MLREYKDNYLRQPSKAIESKSISSKTGRATSFRDEVEVGLHSVFEGFG